MALDVSAEQQMRMEVNALIVHANSIRVSSQETYDAACEYLQETIIPFRKRWTHYWGPLRESAWATYKGIQDKFKQGDDAAEQAERFVKNEIRRWDDAQQKIEQEQQRQAQIEAEAAAREEALQAAVYAADSGASEAEVQAIAEAPVTVVAPPVPSAYQRAAGLSKRDNWSASVVDLSQLVKAAAKEKSLLVYLQPNQTALNQRAKADKSTLRIPGVIAVNNPVISSRGR